MTAQRFPAFLAAPVLLLLAGVWAPAHAQRQGEDYDDADPWAVPRADGEPVAVPG